MLVWTVSLGVLGCGPDGSERTNLPLDGPGLERAGAVVLDACPMDSFHRAALASADMRAVIGEVVMLCLFATEQGQVGPAHPEKKAAIEGDVAWIKGLGYRVSLGVTIGEGNLDWYSSGLATDLLLRDGWRAPVIDAVKAWAQGADGVDVALPAPLQDRARPGVQALIEGLSALRPARSLGVFVPPSVASPSDLEGGDAYDLAALAPSVDKLRVMTLDFSCCAAPGGPSTDPGWATSATRFALDRAPGKEIFATLPLFGTDFSDEGARSVTFLEARGLADYHRADVTRGPTGAPHFSYTDAAGKPHDLWFDDIFSTRLALGAWAPPTMPRQVGVLFYGLGAEEPGLWAALARGRR